MEKICAAQGCNKRISKRMLMCLEHWRMVPFSMQARIQRKQSDWKQHRRVEAGGQRASKEWVKAKNEAIAHVRQLQIIRNEI